MRGRETTLVSRERGKSRIMGQRVDATRNPSMTAGGGKPHSLKTDILGADGEETGIGSIFATGRVGEVL